MDYRVRWAAQVVVERAAVSVHSRLLDRFPPDERWVMGTRYTRIHVSGTWAHSRSRSGAQCETRLGLHAPWTAGCHLRGHQPVLPCAASSSWDCRELKEVRGARSRRRECEEEDEDGSAGAVVERARVSRDGLSSAALPPARLLSLEPACHARAPGHPSPSSTSTSSFGHAHRWTVAAPAYSNANAVQARRVGGDHRAPPDDAIDGYWGCGGTRHAVGRTKVTPGTGVDWMGCCVDDDLLSDVGQGQSTCHWHEADCDFDDDFEYCDWVDRRIWAGVHDDGIIRGDR